jgi:Cyanate permease
MLGAAAGTASAFSLGRPVLGPLLGGWRPLFYYSGVVALGYAVVWLGLTWVVRVGDGGPAADTSGSTAVVADLRQVLSHRDLRLIVVLGVVYLSLVHGLQGWLPTVLESRGLSPDRAGQLTTGLVGAKVVGVLVIPGLADRVDARRVALIGCGLLAMAGVGSIVGGGVTSLALVGIAFAGVAVGGLSPLIRAIPPEFDGIGAELTGVAIGLVFAVGEIGGFLGPVLVGTLHDLTGSYAPGFGLLVVAGGVAVGVSVALRDV